MNACWCTIPCIHTSLYILSLVYEIVTAQVITSPVMNKKPIETAATWEQYGRLKDMNDDKKGTIQCLLKACRALRETQWASDEDNFIQYGKFLCRLARSIVSSQSLETAEAKGIKMEIKSALKQVCEYILLLPSWRGALKSDS